jgi:hypothetical protein
VGVVGDALLVSSPLGTFQTDPARELTGVASARAIAVGGGFAFVVDDAGAVWRADLAGGSDVALTSLVPAAGALSAAADAAGNLFISTADGVELRARAEDWAVARSVLAVGTDPLDGLLATALLARLGDDVVALDPRTGAMRRFSVSAP